MYWSLSLLNFSTNSVFIYLHMFATHWSIFGKITSINCACHNAIIMGLDCNLFWRNSSLLFIKHFSIQFFHYHGSSARCSDWIWYFYLSSSFQRPGIGGCGCLIIIIIWHSKSIPYIAVYWRQATDDRWSSC